MSAISNGAIGGIDFDMLKCDQDGGQQPSMCVLQNASSLQDSFNPLSALECLSENTYFTESLPSSASHISFSATKSLYSKAILNELLYMILNDQMNKLSRGKLLEHIKPILLKCQGGYYNEANDLLNELVEDCPGEEVELNLTTNVVKRIRKELTRIEKCFDCVYNRYKFTDSHQVQVCRSPHLLVWYNYELVKNSGTRLRFYLPAKVLSVNAKSNEAVLSVFSKNKKSDFEKRVVRPTVCDATQADVYLLTNENLGPFDKSSVVAQEKYNAAMALLREHINNLNTRFGYYIQIYASAPTVWNWQQTRLNGFAEPEQDWNKFIRLK